MELAILKNKINKNKNILKIITSLKIMCFTRLKQLKVLNNNMRQNILEIKNNIIDKINNNTIDNYENIESQNIEENNENTTIIINVFLFTDMSFCGNFNDNNKNIINKMKKNLDSCEFNYIIGLKGEK